jgi:ABC-type transporter Mla maintaining outer membrane lipid asymmetry permease subunit MlaE
MFVHKDHLGSVQYISDENGDLTHETGLIAFTTGAIAGFAVGITGGTALDVFGGSALSGMLSGSSLLSAQAPGHQSGK